MFDNIGTALVQAVGFLIIFGYFVFQLLSDSNKTINTQIKSSRKKINESNDLKEKTMKKGLFGRKTELVKDVEKQKKKGLFAGTNKPAKDIQKSKKKGWFN